jgi:hypothetical protein
VINPIPSGVTSPARDSKGRFPKGVSGNPSGPKPGYKWSAVKELSNAITEYETEHGVSYWKAAAQIAMDQAKLGNTTLLGKIMDKFVPSMIEHIDPDEAPERLPFIVRGPNAN